MTAEILKTHCCPIFYFPLPETKQSFLFSKTINTTSFSKYDQKNKHTHTHKQKQTVEIRDSPNYSTNRHLTVSFGSLV